MRRGRRPVVTGLSHRVRRQRPMADDGWVRVLILGGTGEARALASVLVRERPALTVVSSLAGRLTEPVLPAGQVRVGGFGGPAGLVAHLREVRFDAVVDATHPFAATMSASAVAATTAVGVPLLMLRRPGWTPYDGDDWRWVASLPEAAAMLPGLGRRVFLSTGRGGLGAFAGCHGLWFLLRSVDPPDPPMPRSLHSVLARGPFTVEGERALLSEHRIDVLVTKDSGGDMTAAKLRAAAELGLPVVIQRRPSLPSGTPTVATVPEAVHWLDTLP